VLAGLIRGVCLAGEEKDDRTLRIVHEAGEPLAVAQYQRRSLVGREAPREADDEDIGPFGIDGARDVPELRGRQRLARVFALEPFEHEREHLRFHRLSGGPVTIGRSRLERAPEFRIREVLAPLVIEGRVEEFGPGLMQEGRYVHAVRHEADRILFRMNLRPLIRAEPRGHRAVNAAHAIDAACAVQREACHVEEAGRRRRSAELEEALERKAELADEVAEVRDDLIVSESVVPCGDGCMGGEDALRAHHLERGAERQSAVQVLAQQLEDEEGSVAFVQVPHGRRKSERAQGARAAEAEDHLLTDARGLVSAVKAMGDVAVGRRVLRAVRVEQENRDPPDLRPPEASHDVAIRDAHRDLEPLAA
jgi:hypothetical protein